MPPYIAQIDPTGTIDATNQLLASNDINKLLLGMMTVLIVATALVVWTFLRNQPKAGGENQETIVKLATVIGDTNSQNGKILSQLVELQHDSDVRTQAFIETSAAQVTALQELAISMQQTAEKDTNTKAEFTNRHEKIEGHFQDIGAKMNTLVIGSQKTDEELKTLAVLVNELKKQIDDLNQVDALAHIQVTMNSILAIVKHQTGELPAVNTNE